MLLRGVPDSCIKLYNCNKKQISNGKTTLYQKGKEALSVSISSKKKKKVSFCLWAFTIIPKNSGRERLFSTARFWDYSTKKRNQRQTISFTASQLPGSKSHYSIILSLTKALLIDFVILSRRIHRVFCFSSVSQWSRRLSRAELNFWRMNVMNSGVEHLFCIPR